jgi:hypothetical protein
MQGIRAALFDKLQLRSALAEAFSSMGIESEKTWRAAAQIRVLLSQADQPSIAVESGAFWSNPDVRWLAGVNESSGKTYVNKEQFEELVCWLQLPALLDIAHKDLSQTNSLREIEDIVSRACQAMNQAGYDLDKYLALRKGTVSKGTEADDFESVPVAQQRTIRER